MRRFWTDAEKDLLRERYADTRTDELARMLGRTIGQVQSKAAALGLHKSRELIAQMAREISSRADHPSQQTRFAKGVVPWNTGTHWTAGGRSSQTWFKPGQRPHTWVPVGSLRVVVYKNGGPMLERKINDDPGPSCVRWKPVHRLVWEAANGPVPKGHIVVFKPGRRTLELEKITLDAVEMITRHELMRRNTIHNYPSQFADLARLRGVLHRAMNTRARRQNPEEPTA